MKNKMLKISSLVLCVFTFCSCFNYRDKEISKMNLIELNKYNEELIQENEDLKNQRDELKNLTNGKSYQETIDIMNYVNNEIVKSNVMITNESKSFFHATSISSGSGTIIKEDDFYYYVLTNNHVIYSLGNRITYYVYDYLNNEYSNAKVLFSDPNYDMAILRFNKGVHQLRVSTLANEDIKVGNNLIIIGQPQGQRNTITYGEAISYKKVECTNCNPDESNVNYDCLHYNAITTNGNSGGMILDYNYDLVGVVTFGFSDTKGEYLYGAGSPVSKVKEFLAGNEFEVGDNHA